MCRIGRHGAHQSGSRPDDKPDHRKVSAQFDRPKGHRNFSCFYCNPAFFYSLVKSQPNAVSSEA